WDTRPPEFVSPIAWRWEPTRTVDWRPSSRAGTARSGRSGRSADGRRDGPSSARPSGYAASVRLRRARSEDLPKVRPDRVTIRRLVALGRPEAPRLVVGTVFLLIGAAASLAYPQGIKNLINGALRGTDIAAIDHEAMKMVVVALIFGISVAIRFILFSVAGERVVTGLRERLYRSIIDQEIAFFDSRRTGELISRLAADTSVLQSAVSVNVSMALRSLAQAAGGVAYLVYTSRQLTVVMLAVVPAVALGAVIYGKRVRRLARDVQDALAAAGEVAEESIGGIRTVRAFVAERKEGDRYAGAVGKALALARRRIWAGGQFMAIASSASFGAAALVIWYGGRLVLHHQMSPGALTSFLIYTMIVAMALGGLAELWADFMRAAGAAERVFELLDRTPAIPAQGGIEPAQVKGEVALGGVRFAYPTRADVGAGRGGPDHRRGRGGGAGGAVRGRQVDRRLPAAALLRPAGGAGDLRR